MIKELYLENWKSFGSSRLYIDPLTILIGTNASGKSNILDALLFLQKIANGKQITSAINGDQENAGIRGGLEWVIKRNESIAKIEVVIASRVDQNVDYKYQLEVAVVDDTRVEILSESLDKIKTTQRTNRISNKRLFYTSQGEIRDPSITVYFATNTQGRGKKVDLRRSFTVLSQSKPLKLLKEVKEGIDEVLSSVSKIFVLDPIPSHMRNYAKFSERLEADASNIAGVLAALDEKQKAETEEILTHYFQKLPEKYISKVWTEPVGKFRSDAMLYCSEKWNKTEEEFIVDARGMSDGSLRFLAIMTALLTLESGSLLVVEEIDNGFHPSKAKLLVQFLKEIGIERRIDIICTTHNPALLDAFGNEMIAFISLVFREQATGASDIKLLEDLAELPRIIARGSLGRVTTLGLLQDALKE